ncbi:Actin cytoskeleton-regulatory complex protein SLA1, partial [Neolecta irregularis DAH-3]
MAASGLFVGIARAIYAYAAQTPDELSIDEDHVVYVIEKGDDDWWKVKRKPAPGQDEGPSGLVPSNYLEQ